MRIWIRPEWAVASGVVAIALAIGPAAAEPVPPVSHLQAQPSPAVDLPKLTPLNELTGHIQPDPGMKQLTSVSQLTDVRPTVWAFQALQSLVERYGCIAGYPDRSFRGNQTLTRYEFAAGLNACLDRVNELIQAGTRDLVRKEDLITLQRLQEEFAAELTTVRGRVSALETRIGTVQQQQFSPTTKLNGLVWFNVTGAFTTRDVLAERSLANRENPNVVPTRIGGQPSRVLRDEPEITGSYYTFLTLNTSFTGKDSLVTQLVSGTGTSPANQLVSAGFFNTWGTPFLDQTGVSTNAGSVVLRELFYSFPIGSSVQVAIGPRLNFYRHFDNNRFTFYLTGATSFNSNGSTLSNAVDRGSGAVVTWTLSPQFKLTAAYLAENTEFLSPNAGFNTSSNPGVGLFNTTNTITAELDYSPSKTFNLRFLYTRSNLRAYNGFIGGSAGEPVPYGFLDDGFGGTLNEGSANTFILNFDWLITPGIGVFGRYSFGNVQINPTNTTRPDGELEVQSFQVGLGFPDLGKKGALGVLSFVMPHDFTKGRRFLLSGGGDGGTQYDLEASYFYPITPNIAVVPALYAIFNPNNFDSNPTVFVGNLRTQFSF